MAPKSRDRDVDDSVLMKIGNVEGKLDSLIDNFSESDKTSRESRSRVHKELESLRIGAGRVESKFEHSIEKIDVKLEAVEARLMAAEPIIIEIKKWKERFIGMQILVGVVGATVISGTVYVWKWLAIKLGG